MLTKTRAKPRSYWKHTQQMFTTWQVNITYVRCGG